METFLARRPLLSFFALAFGFAYLVWLPVVLAGGFSQLPLTVALLLQLTGPFGPAVAAALVTHAAEGREGLQRYARRVTRWRLHPFWYLLALALPVVTMLGAYAALLTFSNVPADLFGSLTPSGFALAFAVMFFVGGGQEELGWRGFALPRLQEKLGAWVSSLLLGALWALWHLPLFFVPDAPQSSVPFGLYAAHMLAYALLFTWLYNATGGNVLACMALHASGNAFPALTVLAVSPASFASFFLPLIAAEGALAALLLTLSSRRKGRVRPRARGSTLSP